jgi:hypothetical protein
MPATLDWPWYRGDTPKAVRVTVKAGGDPVDLTGSSFAAQVRRFPDSPDVLVDLPVVVDDPETGVVRVVPTDEHARDLGVREAAWDLEWTDTAGRVLTLVAGAVTVTADVTRVEP